MSMKVMQNYHYLMQSNGCSQNNKEMTLSHIHHKNCVCSKLEGPGSSNEEVSDTNNFSKVKNEQLEMWDSYHRNNEIHESEKKTKHAPDSNIHYKNVGSTNIEKYVAKCPSLYSRGNMEPNLYNKISDMHMNPKSGLANFHSGFETGDIVPKKHVSRLYGKDMVSSHLFAHKNISFNPYSKNYNLEIYQKQGENSRSFIKTSSDQGNSEVSVENPKHSLKTPKILFFNRNTNRCNKFNRVITSEQIELGNSELSSKDVEVNPPVSKEECSINSNSDSISSYDEDTLTCLAQNQFLAHSTRKLNLCDICKKSFSTKGNLQNHHIVHSGQKPHECEVCKKTFSQRSTLGKHYLIHTGEKPHICNICGRGFRQANNLRIHLLTHSGEKPHCCSVCNKGFTQKIALQKHMLTHTGVKPHECDVCQRCFTTKGNLQKHFLTHTGEKPHICGICNRGFSQKIALKKHHLTHTGEKPFACNVCGKRFTTKGNLKSHSKRHARDKLVSETASSIAQSLRVPKSIAQSIMLPMSSQPQEQLSASTVSGNPALSGTKSVFSAFSSQIQHPLVASSSAANSVGNLKSHMTSYYSGPTDHPDSSSSFVKSSVFYNQPSKSTAASFRHFLPSPASVPSNSVPSAVHVESPIVYPETTQTSILTNYLPSDTYKQVNDSHSHHLQPSLSRNLPDEPLGVPSDSSCINNTNSTSSSSPLKASVDENETYVEKSLKSTASNVHSHDIPSTCPQNTHLQTSTVIEDKSFAQHITVL